MNEIVCPECGKSFPGEYALSRHRKSLHGVRLPEPISHLDWSGWVVPTMIAGIFISFILTIAGLEGSGIVVALTVGLVGLELIQGLRTNPNIIDPDLQHQQKENDPQCFGGRVRWK